MLLIPDVAVAPTPRGRGHGRRLLAFAEAEARRRGYAEVHLYVSTLMREAVALYQRTGIRASSRSSA
jgi:ribosomal protein S18 acetylase RimI-like enzyme